MRFWFRPKSAADLVAAKSGWHPRLHLNAVEVAALSAWPIGRGADLPVQTSGSRLLPPTAAIPRRGRVVADATFPGAERPLALTPEASLRHLHVLGPTGSGKSTLLLGLIAQDMAAGRGVVVIESKGDLIADVLTRVPASRRADVVLIDPTRQERIVGLNPLETGRRSPELAADQLLGMFHSMYAAHWGPRTHDILSGALLTLARLPGATLPALPLLLSDAGYRRKVLSKLPGPEVGLVAPGVDEEEMSGPRDAQQGAGIITFENADLRAHGMARQLPQCLESVVVAAGQGAESSRSFGGPSTYVGDRQSQHVLGPGEDRGDDLQGAFYAPIHHAPEGQPAGAKRAHSSASGRSG